MSFASRFVASVLVVAGAAALASAARADEPSAIALAKRLHRVGKQHPFADTSGKIPFTAAIPAGVDAASLGLFEVAPGIGAVRLAPDEIDAFAKAHPKVALHTGPPRRAMLDVSKKWVNSEVYRNETGRDGKGVVVGVVDTGLDVAHPDFRNADGTTRVAWMLVAGTPHSPPNDSEQKFCSSKATTKCTVIGGAELDSALTQGGFVPNDAEGHGTHVTSIAAGNGGAEKTYVGMAPGATIVMAAPSGNGGFSDGDILNGAKFVFDRADALGLPCVLNLSLGGDYGGHDGTSDLEKGLAALVGPSHPGHAIVVAAGNSASLFDTGDGNIYGIHTEVHVAPDSRVRVPFSAPKAAKGQGYVWITFQPGDEISVGLEGPEGSQWIGQVAAHDNAGYCSSTTKGKCDPDANTGSVVNDDPKQDPDITKDSNSAIVVITGKWPDSTFALTLEGHGQAQLWLTSGGDLDTSIGLQFERGMKQGTVSVPATSPDLLAVGCTLNRNQWTPIGQPELVIQSFGGVSPVKPDGTCFFSGAGPTATGVPKPEISAPGGFVAAAMASLADPRVHPGGIFDGLGCPTKDKCYVVDNEHAIAEGTSMSSPHVTGAVALLLEANPTLTQPELIAAIEGGSRRASGAVPLDYQIGGGVLDVVGAQAALDGKAKGPIDLAKSWYELSSGYARADGATAIYATVELRHADGTPAADANSDLLATTLEGASLLQPITKIGTGLFRFSFAAPAGSVGEKVTVEVGYGGKSLGKRTLSDGTDPFNITGSFDTTSGSSCALSTQSSRSRGAAIFVAFGALALWRRRRARSS